MVGLRSHLLVLLPAKSSQKYKPLVGQAQAVFAIELLDDEAALLVAAEVVTLLAAELLTTAPVDEAVELATLEAAALDEAELTATLAVELAATELATDELDEVTGGAIKCSPATQVLAAGSVARSSW